MSAQKNSSLVSKKTLITGALIAGLGFAAYKYLTFQHPNPGGGRFEDVMAAMLEEGDRLAALRPKDTTPVQRFKKATGPVVPILVLYGTEYGFSQSLAHKVADQIRGLGTNLWPRVLSMEEHQFAELDKEQVVVIVCSTQGDGVPPAPARPFFDYLEENKASLNLSHIEFSVLALGDKGYPHFCRAGKTLDARFEEFKGKRFHNRRDVDLEDWTAINGWMDAVCEKLKGMQHLQIQPDYLYEKEANGELVANNKVGTKNRPYYAPMMIKKLLTIESNKEEIKETIHFEFNLGDSEIEYACGDSLAVYPSNCTELVEETLAALGAKGTEMIATPSWHYIENGKEEKEKEISIRHAFYKCFDLKNLKPELLEVFRKHATNAVEKQKLDELLAMGVGKDNKHLTAYLAGRELIDLLLDFPKSKPSNNSEITAQLRPLLPRFYSISSSQSLDKKKVTATIAVVRYKTHSRNRKGVTTTFLSDRVKVGEAVPIYINKNPDFRLPTDHSKPILMIGPGTGIAPFRSFVQERHHHKASGSNILYFGCRRRDEDFLYADELAEYEKNAVLKLHTAFSREQQNKVYVQNRLRENSSDVWALIEQGGHIYVCGDAQNMAGSVHEALVDILKEHGKIEAPEAYLTQLEHDKRYQRDIWF